MFEGEIVSSSWKKIRFLEVLQSKDGGGDGSKEGDWLGAREEKMDGDRSWRGVQNHPLDVCEITLTVRLHRQNKHQEEERYTVSHHVFTH